MPGTSLNMITHAIEADRKLQRVLGEQEGTFLMAALMVESGKRALQDGVSFGTWLEQVEALVQEHRPS